MAERHFDLAMICHYLGDHESAHATAGAGLPFYIHSLGAEHEYVESARETIAYFDSQRGNDASQRGEGSHQVGPYSRRRMKKHRNMPRTPPISPSGTMSVDEQEEWDDEEQTAETVSDIGTIGEGVGETQLRRVGENEAGESD